MHRIRTALSIVAVIGLVGVTLFVGGVGPAVAVGPADVGQFSAPFSENGEFNAAPPGTVADSVKYPPAVSSVALPNGKFLYWTGLENLETAAFPLAIDAARVAKNSRTRLLDLSDREHPKVPTPEDGGGGDLFCADQRILLNGDVLAAGGTIWKSDPVDLSPHTGPGGPGGTAELFGNPAARVYTPDASGGTWTQADSMAYGRWYPTLVTLPDGKLFVAGGVGRLLYNTTGFNVKQSETFNPYVGGAYDPKNGTWSENGPGGETTLPLFARLHLAHTGKVLYDGVGQMWGPFGQALDEALWNVMRFYDPATKTWSDAGIGTYGAINGAASVLLPFVPDASGAYSKTRVLHAGGTLLTSPGAYAATPLSEIVEVDNTGKITAKAGPLLNKPRWYSSSVIGPTGEVFLFNGSDKDEVIMPNSESAVRLVESYDPATNTWKALASSGRDRTYHNSAVLMADGRILVGGHSPINSGYGPGNDNTYTNASGGAVANNLKDPSFEIYSPPYLFRGPRPKIGGVNGNLRWGTTQTITMGAGTLGTGISKAVLVHMPSTTHITDADMRSVELKIVSASAGSIKVKIPSQRGVTPPGWYYLFVTRDNGSGPTPSIAWNVRVGNNATFGGSSAGIIPAQAQLDTTDAPALAAKSEAAPAVRPVLAVEPARASRSPLPARRSPWLPAALAMSAVVFGFVLSARRSAKVRVRS